MNNLEEKKKARVKFKTLRNKIIFSKEQLILLQVKKFLHQFSINEPLNSLIGIYWPLKGEVDLRGLRNELSLSFALPAGNSKGELNYHKWTSAPLIKDAFGIPAPLSEPPLLPSEIKLLIVPALAIDQNGTRLGYGGGCFDRLRKDPSWKTIKALAIIPNICFSKKLLPMDQWDIPFDGWIDEKGTFEIHKG